MGSRAATSVADIQALNNCMYGGGTHGTVIAHKFGASKKLWDDRRIKAIMTESFVKAKVPNEAGLRKKLSQPMDFGGLTSTTYMEWIITKSPKLFLTLVDIEAPEQIFPILDESLDDDDLPFDMDEIARLQLSPNPSKPLDRAFWHKQYKYVLRELNENGHIDYLSMETIPLEEEEVQNVVSTINQFDKVFLPRRETAIMGRKRVQLNDGGSISHGMDADEFLDEVRQMRAIRHPHIVRLFASYTFDDGGFLITSPICDLTLSMFLQYPPYTWKVLTKEQRRSTLMNWLHCLSSALSYLHHKGCIHGDISPSSIVVDGNGNNVLFSSIGNARKLDPITWIKDKEVYDYSAPERWPEVWSAISPATASSAPRHSLFSFRKSSTSSVRSSSDSNSIRSVFSDSGGRRTSEMTIPDTFRGPSPVEDPERADVFSLACVAVDIINVLCKRKAASFVTHRAGKNPKQYLPFGSLQPDSSFHANLERVQVWLSVLKKDAMGTEKANISIRKAIAVCQETLTEDIVLRPTARELTSKFYSIVSHDILPNSTHCDLDIVDKGVTDPFPWENFTTATENALYANGRRGNVPKLHHLDSDFLRCSMSDAGERSRSVRSSGVASIISHATANSTGSHYTESLREFEEKQKKKNQMRKYVDGANLKMVGAYGDFESRGGWGW